MEFGTLLETLLRCSGIDPHTTAVDATRNRSVKSTNALPPRNMENVSPNLQTMECAAEYRGIKRVPSSSSRHRQSRSCSKSLASFRDPFLSSYLSISGIRMSTIMSVAKAVFNVPYRLAYHAWTAFLFTKSDIKTTLIPIVSFQTLPPLSVTNLKPQSALAAASAPLASLKQLPPTMFWIWLILLQFNISNQTVGPAEDQNNKPDRPLPAGRLSYRTALILRWLMPFVCLAWSYSYSKEVAAACLAGCFLTWVYNEAGFASGHWAGRNIVNGLGMASFETGASLIAGQYCSRIPAYFELIMYFHRRERTFVGQNHDLRHYLQCSYLLYDDPGRHPELARHVDAHTSALGPRLQGHNWRRTCREAHTSPRPSVRRPPNTPARCCSLEHWAEQTLGSQHGDCSHVQRSRTGRRNPLPGEEQRQGRPTELLFVQRGSQLLTLPNPADERVFLGVAISRPRAPGLFPLYSSRPNGVRNVSRA